MRVGDTSSKVGIDLLNQRYQSLQRQVPLLYAGVMSCFIGLYLATSGQLIQLASPMMLVFVLVFGRLAHWLHRRYRTLSPLQVERELRGTLIFSIIFSVFFCAWALYLFGQPRTDRQFVLLFGSLASVGSAYGLSSFPKAARMPLLLLGLPLALRSALSGEVSYVGAGVALALIIILVFLVLKVHNKRLEELTVSRSETELERERAQLAERTALLERENAEQLAATDYLTGLANRRAFMRALDNQLAVRPASATAALVIVDLDGFKPINDSFGHASGDAVLRVIAGRLAEAIDGNGTCARIGGDEFAVLIANCPSERAAKMVATQLSAAIEEPVHVGGREFRISGCCGITLIGAQDSQASDLLLRADTALYEAKKRGRGGVSVFSTAMDLHRKRRSTIENALRQPSINSRIKLLYQPIIDLRSGGVTAFEALARWEDGQLGEVPPSEFIPIAERIGVIEEISTGLLRQAVAEALNWPEHVVLSFNLSTVQLRSDSLATRILREVRKQGLAPSRLQIEVTETVLLVDFETARANLTKLRAEGVCVSLDDFGAGYASISYLQEMQFDSVKLDGSLIRTATTSRQAKRLLKGVINLCSSLGVPCVAEHVETEEQLDLLLQMQCGKAQGHLLSPPLPSVSATTLVSRATPFWHMEKSGTPHSKRRAVKGYVTFGTSTQQ